MTNPTAPWDHRRTRQNRDRALSRITAVTVAGGAGAVLGTGAVALWLSSPAHAHPGSVTSTSSGSSPESPSGSSTSPHGDDGLSGTQPPIGGQRGGGSQQPPVVSGGS